MLRTVTVAAAFVASATAALNVTDIQGSTFNSPYVNQLVNVTGIVTAKSSQGWYIQSGPTDDVRVSSGLKVFTTSATTQALVKVGDLITLQGKILEYRSDASYLTVTELSSPTQIQVLSSDNAVQPLALGRGGRSPPTISYTSLDNPSFLGVPNNSSLIQTKNLALEPEKYALDFWESLEGMLVTIPKPVALNFENQYGEFWVRGDWPVTNLNQRGGLTMAKTADGQVDIGVETVIIGKPLDGSKLPLTWMGTEFQGDITGVVEYTFGFYYVLPLTAPVVANAAPTALPVTTIEKSTDPCILTTGGYNVENLSVNSTHLPSIADHIVNHMKSPELLFLQEIQDNDGPTDSGNVDASGTLQKLVDAINTASNGTAIYNFTEVLPVNNQDGGAPGGNIRTAYIWQPSTIKLVDGTAGGPTDANEPVKGTDGLLNLKFNPGRIDPTSAAWTDSRKPIAAVWEKVGKPGERFVTIDVHFTSKGGSSSAHGDARPPVNGGVDQRKAQLGAVVAFTQAIYAIDNDAAVITAGDFNEFTMTDYVYDQVHGVFEEVDDVANVPTAERYTYTFDNTNQMLDHFFVSPAVARRGVKVEHVHVNTWAVTYKARISDHDPSVVQANICKPPPAPQCAYKIDNFCAEPLPKFNDARTCSIAVAKCFEEAGQCLAEVSSSFKGKCLGQGALCTKYSLTCAACLIPGHACSSFPSN